MTGWIADENRWNLPEPPAWAQAMLTTYDAQLVVIPSRLRREYLLARRRQYSAGIGDVAMLDNKHPDTNMCYAHGLLPVRPLVFKDGIINWSQRNVNGLIDQLKARDTWAHTGGPGGVRPDAAWQAVEEHEKGIEQKERANLRDTFYHMARDAYRSIKARSGQRSKRASDHHGVARTPPMGQRIIVP